jgi:hypothetical protein
MYQNSELSSIALYVTRGLLSGRLISPIKQLIKVQEAALGLNNGLNGAPFNLDWQEIN